MTRVTSASQARLEKPDSFYYLAFWLQSITSYADFRISCGIRNLFSLLFAFKICFPFSRKAVVPSSLSLVAKAYCLRKLLHNHPGSKIGIGPGINGHLGKAYCHRALGDYLCGHFSYGRH